MFVAANAWEAANSDSNTKDGFELFVSVPPDSLFVRLSGHA
jgi:hypothetical protein